MFGCFWSRAVRYRNERSLLKEAMRDFERRTRTHDF